MDDLVYLAGFFDGEGCVRSKLTRGRPTGPQVSASNTDVRPLELLQRHFGGRIGLLQPRLGIKPVFDWQIWGSSARSCLEALLPYLIVKAQQARLGIELAAWTPGVGKAKKQDREHLPLRLALFNALRMAKQGTEA